ncbi:hypothetical protein FB45DRAFT_899203 [Roridomyces roridus]|uniref:F-box domain-containing protein n=1 Tax=Roridomyces roridus TaxID=1738132 RepID=A0AAD7F7B7_9AGAR|nr:hypothetical protein FB45DRAFT_949187 [Roridomyces roridus]KAJ7640978.1 hypothetical protein FB45DRAFT_899203 [Roridomyces roridus]
MDSCPTEILLQIASFLPSEDDLQNLRLVGRRLCDAATQYAFLKLVVFDHACSVRRFIGLLECEDQRILHVVENVVFNGLQTDHYALGADPTLPLLTHALSLIHRLPKLHSLRLDFMPDEDNPTIPAEGGHTFNSYYLQVQLACIRGLTSNPLPLPRLRTLHLGSLHGYIPHELQTDAFFTLFRPLTHLSIRVQSLLHRVNLPDEVSLFDETLSRIFENTPHLTSLELASASLEGPCSVFRFEDFRIPSLRSLSVRGFVLAGQDDGHPIPASVVERGTPLALETFILNHAHMLRRLEMHDCVVALPNGSWDNVFRRIRLRLTQLVEFVWIAQPAEEMNCTVLYAGFDFNERVNPAMRYAIRHDIMDFEGVQKVQLEMLQEAVLSRSSTR